MVRPLDRPRPELALQSLQLNHSSGHRRRGALLAKGVPFDIIPVPSWIRAGCGLALRLPPEAVAAALEVLTGAELIYEDLHSEREGRTGPT
jgi:hypothetical protein